MARMRYIKPEYWTDGAIVALSAWARLFYIGTWNFAVCDAGHLPDDAHGLKLKILPADPVDGVALLEELLTSGRIVRRRLPDGRTYSLDQFIGLNQIGDAGLRGQVNQHYWSTFGAAAAVGVISGLGQYLGTLGLGQGAGDRTVVITGGLGNTTAQATAQVMSHFLNRLPTVTIREGHRVAIYLTSDLELPVYESRNTATGPSLARVP